MGSPFRAHKSGRAEVVEGRLAPPAPTRRGSCWPGRATYMNECGGPVSTLAKFYKVAPDRIVAVHDELDLPFGTLRIKLGGGDNGHNGLRSMRASLGTGDFYRVRVGIGRPPGRQDPADFVLSDYSADRAQGAGRPARRGRRRGREPDGRRAGAHPAAVQPLSTRGHLARVTP